MFVNTLPIDCSGQQKEKSLEGNIMYPLCSPMGEPDAAKHQLLMN